MQMKSQGQAGLVRVELNFRATPTNIAYLPPPNGQAGADTFAAGETAGALATLPEPISKTNISAR